MFIIGIDGGGTSTQGAIASKDLSVIAETQVGATNYHNVGLETAKTRIGTLLESLLEASGATVDQVLGICIGGAGIDCEADQRVIENIFRELGWTCPLIAVNDAVTALVGGNQALEGIVIISGTGSIGLASYEGKIARCGGWGQLIDDVGSGYYLGISALKGIMEAYDERREATCLWDPIAAHLEIGKEEDIIHFLYNPQTGKEKIAELAPYVIQLAHTDSLAKEIVDSGVKGLMSILSGLLRQTGQDKAINENTIQLTLGGSLMTKSECYRNAFESEINAKYPHIEVHLPYEGPVAGALRIIKDHMEKEREYNA
jgi:N-acetylglucosamine kinase-like BadF-type ATPase